MRRWVAVLLFALACASCSGDESSPPIDGGPPPPDADPGAPDADGVCGTTPFLMACATNSDCESCLCHTYGMGQMLCTTTCSSDGDCPAPSPGCSGMGVCRRP